MSGFSSFSKGKGFETAGGLYGMLDELIGDFWPANGVFGASFRLDLEDGEQEYVLSAELPGVRKEDIRFDFSGQDLIISVSRRETGEDNAKQYILRERRACAMRRAVELPDARPDGLRARLEDGVLYITVPKQEKKESAVQVEFE